MSRRVLSTAFFRMVLLTMLALGLCLQPMLAAACDIDDVRAALDHGSGPALIASDMGSSGVNDCCASPACSDCCLHATASLPDAAVAGVFAMPRIEVTVPISNVRSSNYPVDVRPPIAN